MPPIQSVLVQFLAAGSRMNHLNFFRTPHAGLVALFAGTALSCCSCTTMKSMARTEDFSEEIQRARQQRPAQLALNTPAETPGVMRLAGKPRSDILQVTHQEGYSLPEPYYYCPPEPRMPVGGPNPYGVGMPLIEMANVPNPEHFADEYLCDGGDREWPVHYDEHQRLGLDTEDTVAEYVDHRGKERMKPSNKVCVYAPRFAAVRTISQPVQGEGLHKSVGMINATVDDELRTRLTATQKTKRDSAGGLRVRSRASGIETDESGAGVVQDIALVQHDKINNLFQSFNFTHYIHADHATAARLNYGLGAAQAWSLENSPVITAKIEVPTEGLFEISAQTITVIDDQPSDEPGQLQIAKFADKKDAKPGDVITFTIRYHNAGPREVHYVRIVDNLTPRLEYVEDSAQLVPERDGRLAVEDNGEGSLVLTFELTDPLAAKAGGTITFQARVR